MHLAWFLSLLLVLALAGCIIPPAPAPAPAPGGANENAISFPSPVNPPDGRVGDAYQFSFCEPFPRDGPVCGGLEPAANPVGGKPPYSLSIGFDNGFLPPGLRLNLNGVVEGTPTLEGDFAFSVCARDGFGTEGCRPAFIHIAPKEEEPAPRPQPEPVPQPAPAPQPAPEPPPVQISTWRGTLSGEYSEHNGNYAPCLGASEGAFSESWTVSFKAEDGFAEASKRRNVEMSDATLEGKEEVARQPSESYCRLAPTSVSLKSVDIYVGWSRDKLEITFQPLPDDEHSLWASSTDLSGGPFRAPHRRLILLADSVSDSTISGTWRTTDFGAKGTFTLNKQG